MHPLPKYRFRTSDRILGGVSYRSHCLLRGPWASWIRKYRRRRKPGLWLSVRTPFRRISGGLLRVGGLQTTCASGYIPCSSCSGREKCGHHLATRQWCTSARRSSSLLCKWALQMLSWSRMCDCLLLPMNWVSKALPRSLLALMFCTFLCRTECLDTSEWHHARGSCAYRV